MASTRHTWIDSDEALAEFGETLSAAPSLAVDTESDGFHHYFDKLCLLQFSTPDANFLVDALAVSSLEPLRPALADPDLRKVMHAAEQDIMYLRRDHGLEVKGLFDTSVAAQFIGHTRLGLAALLESFFAVQLSKSNQRDDWSRRPLNPAQLAYAVADTNLLLPLADRLDRELRDLDRMEWAVEEFHALELRQINLNSAEIDDITRIKGWRKLPPRGRAILRELLCARDEEARRRDRPAFRVAPGSLLLDLATRPPTSQHDLLKRKGFPRQRPAALAEQFMAAVNKGRNLPEDQLPGSPPRAAHRATPSRRDDAFEARINKLRAWRQEAATRLNLEPGVVISQRDLELVAENPPGSPGEAISREAVRCWRWREFSGQWQQLLAAGA